MTSKTCKICGKPSGEYKYCSEECAMAGADRDFERDAYTGEDW